MSKLDRAAWELREMDEMAEGTSAIHSIHALAKLLVTITYVFVTASFDKYDFSGLIVMVLYPVLLFTISDISFKTCLYKLRFLFVLVCAVGILNPFLDRTVLFRVGSVTVTGGWVSLFTLMLKGVLCLSASFLLAATTSIDKLCAALRMVHCPKMIVTLILLTYRYVLLMIEEVANMTVAYELRAPGQRGIHHSAWGSFLGQLLLRSMDRAEELYGSMLLRGFHGEFHYAGSAPMRWKDWCYTVLAIGGIIFCRVVNLAELLGRMVG